MGQHHSIFSLLPFKQVQVQFWVSYLHSLVLLGLGGAYEECPALSMTMEFSEAKICLNKTMNMAIDRQMLESIQQMCHIQYQ